MRTSFALALVIAGLATLPTSTLAQTVTWNSVKLSWTAPGDDSLTGTASQYDLRYSTSPITANNFASAAQWTSMPAPGSGGTTQTVTVTGLNASTTYYFALKTADEVPNWSGISNVISQTTLAAPDAVRPAALSTVAVTGSTERTVTLSWTATGDDSLSGTATSYDLRYSTSPITGNSTWNSATQVTGEPAPTAAGTTQGMTVSGLTRQTTYYFAIKVADEGGNISALSNAVSTTTPDQTAPAAVRDLVVGFLWFGWDAGTPAFAVAVRPEDGRPQDGGER